MVATHRVLLRVAMAVPAAPSDAELRAQLEKRGFSPGPITDSTRALYLEKLNKLKDASGGHPKAPGPTQARDPSNSSLTTAAAGREQGAKNDKRNLTSRPLPKQKNTSGPKQTDRVKQKKADEDSTPSHPRPPPTHTTSSHPPPPPTHSTPSHPPPPPTHSTPSHPPPPPTPLSSTEVVSRLLLSLNDHTHMASDVAFIFPEATVYTANSGILATQCPELIPILYCREDPLPLLITTLSGHSSQYFVYPSEHVADLKLKISLGERIPLNQLRLIFLQNELTDEILISQSELKSGSTIHLVLVSTVTRNPAPSFFSSSVSPSLSVAHFRLGLGLEQLHPASHSSPQLRPPRLPLPSHITRIVHMYDVPEPVWKLFIHYLYSRELSAEETPNLAQLICCHVLALTFKDTSLTQLTLDAVRHLLNADSAVQVLHFSERIQAHTLRQLCTEFLTQNGVTY